MESFDEGQGRPFCRSTAKKMSESSSNSVKLTPDGLSTTRLHAQSIERRTIPDRLPGTQQSRSFQHTTPSFPLHQSNISNPAATGAAWTGAPRASHPYASTSIINNNLTGLIQIAQIPATGSGHEQHYSCVNDAYPQQIPCGVQPQQTFNQGVQNALPPQLAFGTESHGYDPLQQEVGKRCLSLPQCLQNNPAFTQYCTTSPVASSNPEISLPNPASGITMAASDSLVNKHRNSIPVWLINSGQPAPVCQLPLKEEVINLSTPPQDSSQPRCEPSSFPGNAREQLKGSHTRNDVIYATAPNCSPSKSVVPQVRRDMREMRSPASKAGARDCLSPSIDVDNEDHDACRGRNRPVNEDAIDLSNEAIEEPKTKLKKQGSQNSKLLERPFKIPSKTLNKCDASSAFKDPLLEDHRKPIGPPPSPFPKQVNVLTSPRRSPRFTSKSRRGISVANLTNSRDHTVPENSPVDCQLPLGGIPKEKRERKTDGNSFMNSNRSTTKRRRPNCANGTNVSLSGSHDLRDTEKRSLSGRQPLTRRKQQDGRSKSKKQGYSSGDVKRVSGVEEVIDDDSDDGFSFAMRQRKNIDLQGQDIRKEEPGDSPLSNTVGDGSNSDDDDIGAGGNELSSDDDGASRPQQPTSGVRKRHRNATKRSQPGDESPGSSRTQRRQTTVPTQAASLNDSDDSCFMETGGKSVKKGTKGDTGRRSNRRKATEESVISASPVNLISPSTPRSRQEPIRRSPRKLKKRVAEGQMTGAVSTDGSDEDFDDSRVKTRLRSKTDRNGDRSVGVTRSAGKKLNFPKDEKAERKLKKQRTGANNVDCSTSDGEAEPSHGSQEEEDSDTAGEILSQELGSQPIEIKVQCVKKRKKANPKEYAEKEFKKMSPDELAIIRVAFIKRYPAPPSNMQAQGRYEAAHGVEMTAGMVQKTWETQLKPWSDRWWKFYLDFNKVVREKKLAKPRSKDPTIKEREVKAWVEEYYKEHGDARPAPQDATVSEKAQ